KAEVSVPLMIFNRNQGNIQAAEAELASSQDNVRQVELNLRQRLANAVQRYDSARQQVQAYETNILPNTRETLRLMLIGYERGDAKYDYLAVWEAQRTLAQANLTYVQALGEMWRAVCDVAGLLQQDDVPVGGITMPGKP